MFKYHGTLSDLTPSIIQKGISSQDRCAVYFHDTSPVNLRRKKGDSFYDAEVLIGGMGLPIESDKDGLDSSQPESPRTLIPSSLLQILSLKEDSNPLSKDKVSKVFNYIYMSLFSLEETFLRCLEGVEVEKRLGRPLRGNPGLFVCRLLTIQESQEVRGRIFLERRAIIKVVQKHPKTRNGLECKFFGFRSIQLLSRCEPPSIKNDSSGHSC